MSGHVSSLLTPGLYYQPVQPVRAAGPLARGDVPALIGYTRRGPPFAPVRLESFRQFVELFGDSLPAGHLAGAVKGFFECGGRAAYVVRVVDGNAAGAEAAVSKWQARASFPWPRIDPRRVRGGARGGALAWTVLFDEQVRSAGQRTRDPGAWGNGLAVGVTRQALALTTTIPDPAGDGWSHRVGSLGGLEAGSVVELSQDLDAGGIATHVTAVAGIDRIDPARQTIIWAKRPADLPAAGTRLDPSRPMRLESVEFRVDVLLDGRLAERFEHVSPHPAHGRAINRVLAEESRFVTLSPPPKADPADRAGWPAEGLWRLTGGRDGLSKIAARHLLEGLEASARADEVALVAVPDLVWAEPRLPPAIAAPPTAPLDCCDLTPPRAGRVIGWVEDAERSALAGVAVEAAGQRTQTDAAGRFAFADLPAGLVDLVLTLAGYEPLETLAEASEFPGADVKDPGRTIALAPNASPHPLNEDEIVAVQVEMANPARVGRYRVAVLDPPRANLTVDELRTWRMKLGDSARAMACAPWLRVPDGAGGLLDLPPSGHVCGAFAAAEAADGVHRAPANLALRYAAGVTLAIGDAEQGLLNPLGLNAIRAFPGRGVRLWGARTLASDPEWRFVTTRRLIDAIERTLESGLAWAVFEPNGEVVRRSVAFSVSSLLGRMWRAGMLAGDTPEAAFSVRCDEETNPPAERDAGRLIAEVAVAPAIPFEFVVFRVARAFDAIEVTE